MAERKTVINIYGGPGAGKSTAALQLVAELKKRGINADYVSEYAKELVYTKNFDKLDGSVQNHREIFYEQKSRLDVMLAGAEVVVTDSPLPLNAVYLKDKSDTYKQNVITQFNQYHNFNILIERDLSAPFETEGRIHNLEESMEKDTEIVSMLYENQIPFQRFDRNDIAEIAETISKIRNQEPAKVPVQEKAPNRERIFVDMDGVLAKFNHVQSEEELYEKGYFAQLEPLPTVVDGMKQYIKEHPDKDIYILSAYLTESPYALQEKNEWLDRYLPEIQSDHRIFCPCGKQKANYIIGGIKETDILIDDYTKNLEQWKQQGGIGVKLLNGINGNYGTWQDYRVTAESFHKDFTELSPTSRITIRCNLSEHPGFDGGKLYTVKEFDRLMKEYDKEWRERHPDGYYAKVKFTVNLPNATTITERQDIGDGYGGVVDFFKSISSYKKTAELLEKELHGNRDLDNSQKEQLKKSKGRSR